MEFLRGETIGTAERCFVGVRLNGVVTSEQMATLFERVRAQKTDGAKVCLLVDFCDVTAFEWRGVMTKLRQLPSLWRAFDQIAYIGDQPWLAKWVGIARRFTPFEVRYFDDSERERAWAWLGAREVVLSVPVIPPSQVSQYSYLN